MNVTEVDKVSFPLRSLRKTPSYSRYLLDTYLSTCPYRHLNCTWLNNLVSGVSYEGTDLTHTYLYLNPPPDRLLDHQVVRTYTQAAWQFAGGKAVRWELLRVVLFAGLWTFNFLSESGTTLRDTRNIFRIISFSLLLLYTPYISVQTVWVLQKVFRKQLKWLNFELKMVDNELDNLHPCMWNAYHVIIREKKILSKQILHLKVGQFLWQEAGELLILVLSLLVLVLDIVLTAVSRDMDRKPHLNRLYMVLTSSLLVLVWTNCVSKLRYYTSFAPFLGNVKELLNLLAKFSVVFMAFYIPIACVFWKTIYEGHVAPADSNSTHIGFFDALYRVYKMPFASYASSEELDVSTSAGTQAWWGILTVYWLTLGGVFLWNLLSALTYHTLSLPSHRQTTRDRLLRCCREIMGMNPLKRQEFARFLELDCKPWVMASGEVGGRGVNESCERSARDVEEELERLFNKIDEIALRERTVSTSSGGMVGNMFN